MAFAGIAVALVTAELVFRWRDDAAFPHLNVYRTDPVLGVRLEPGTSERLRLPGNPTTSVRINADGYRGDDWPAPGANETIVVGDSQVFGLGVEEDETFSAKLAERQHATVLNVGVPTYGPDEYRAVISELLATRHAKTVVVALNIANDLFEASHPNRTRHAVWDGWAVRKENAPDDVTEFPGRDLLFRRSHLVFALRKWWHDSDGADERGFASEGTWRDLITTGREFDDKREALNQQRRQLTDERRKLQVDLVGADNEIDRAIISNLPDFYADYTALEASRSSPGDIVSNGLFEGARSVVVTAEMIRAGAQARDRIRAKLAEWAKHGGKDTEPVKTALAMHDRALARLTEVDAKRIAAALEPPLLPFVKQTAELCAQHGARLVIVVLPIDVQVSPTEWAKYGAPPLDMTGTKQFTDELVRETEGLGITALDATKPLAAAEPGAFLDHDIHMTPKGHAAVAEALAAAIAAPPPARRLAAAPERSPVPLPAVWDRAQENMVTGSTSAGCETKQVREWLRVICGRTDAGDDPTDVVVEHDDGGEALALAMPHQASLVVPVVQGRETTALFKWTDHTRRLRVRWPAGADKPTLAFDAPVRGHGQRGEFTGFSYQWKAADFKSPVERKLCECWGQVYKGRKVGEPVSSCSGVYGAADKRCVDRYANRSCQQMIECTWRDPASPPDAPNPGRAP
jgi:SGNH hydrolase-like domain, acetyltransferase AlgX